MGACVIEKVRNINDLFSENPADVSWVDMKSALGLDDEFVNRIINSVKEKGLFIRPDIFNRTSIYHIYRNAFEIDKLNALDRHYFHKWLEDNNIYEMKRMPFFLTDIIHKWFYELITFKNTSNLNNVTIKVLDTLLSVKDANSISDLKTTSERVSDLLSEIVGGSLFNSRYDDKTFTENLEMTYLLSSHPGNMLSIKGFYNRSIEKAYLKSSSSFDKYAADTFYSSVINIIGKGLYLDPISNGLFNSYKRNIIRVIEGEYNIETNINKDLIFKLESEGISGINIVVFKSIDELPESVKNVINLRGNKFSDIRAFVYKGVIYINEQSITDKDFYGKDSINDILLEELTHLVTLYFSNMFGGKELLSRIYEHLKEKHPDLVSEASLLFSYLNNEETIEDYYHEVIAYVVVNSKGNSNISWISLLYRYVKRLLIHLLLKVFGGLKYYNVSLFSSLFDKIEKKLQYEKELDNLINRIDSFTNSRNKISDIVKYIRLNNISQELFEANVDAVLFHAAAQGIKSNTVDQTQDTSIVVTLGNISDIISKLNIRVGGTSEFIGKYLANSKSKEDFTSLYTSYNQILKEKANRSAYIEDSDLFNLSYITKVADSVKGIMQVGVFLAKLELVSALVTDFYSLDNNKRAKIKNDLESNMSWSDFLKEYDSVKTPGSNVTQDTYFKNFRNATQRLAESFKFVNVQAIEREILTKDKFLSYFRTFMSSNQMSDIDVVNTILAKEYKINIDTFLEILETIESLKPNAFGTDLAKTIIENLTKLTDPNNTNVPPDIKKQAEKLKESVTNNINTIRTGLESIYNAINKDVALHFLKAFSKNYALSLFLRIGNEIIKSKVPEPLDITVHYDQSYATINEVRLNSFNQIRSSINNVLNDLTNDYKDFNEFISENQLYNPSVEYSNSDGYSFAITIYLNALYKLERNLPLKPAEDVMIRLINLLFNYSSNGKRYDLQVDGNNIYLIDGKQYNVGFVKKYITAVVYSLLPFMSLDAMEYFNLQDIGKFKDIKDLQFKDIEDEVYKLGFLVSFYFAVQNIMTTDVKDKDISQIRTLLDLVIKKDLILDRAIKYLDSNDALYYDRLMGLLFPGNKFDRDILTMILSNFSSPVTFTRANKVHHWFLREDGITYEKAYMFFIKLNTLGDLKDIFEKEPSIEILSSETGAALSYFPSIIGVPSFYRELREKRSITGFAILLDLKSFFPLKNISAFSRAGVQLHNKGINISERTRLFIQGLDKRIEKDKVKSLFYSRPFYVVRLNEDVFHKITEKINGVHNKKYQFILDIIQLVDKVNSKKYKDVSELRKELYSGFLNIMRNHDLKEIEFGNKFINIDTVVYRGVFEDKILNMFFLATANMNDNHSFVKELKKGKDYVFYNEVKRDNYNQLLYHISQIISELSAHEANFILNGKNELYYVTEGQKITELLNDTTPVSSYDLKKININIEKEIIPNVLHGLFYILGDVFDIDMGQYDGLKKHIPYLPFSVLYYLAKIGLNYRYSTTSDNKTEHKVIYDNAKELTQKLLEYLYNGYIPSKTNSNNANSKLFANELSYYIREAIYQKEYKNKLKNLDVGLPVEMQNNLIRSITIRDTKLFALAHRLNRKYTKGTNEHSILSKALYLFSDINTATVNESVNYSSVVKQLHKTITDAHVGTKSNYKIYENLVRSSYKLTENSLIRFVDDDGSVKYIKDKVRETLQKISQQDIDTLGLYVIDDSNTSNNNLSKFKIDKNGNLQDVTITLLKEAWGVYLKLKNNTIAQSRIWEFSDITKRIEDFFNTIFDIDINNKITGLKPGVQMSAIEYAFSLYDIINDLKSILFLSIDKQNRTDFNTFGIKELKELTNDIENTITYFNRALYNPLVSFHNLVLRTYFLSTNEPDRTKNILKNYENKSVNDFINELDILLNEKIDLKIHRKTTNNAKITKDSINTNTIKHNIFDVIDSLLTEALGVPLSNNESHIKLVNKYKGVTLVDIFVDINIQAHKTNNKEYQTELKNIIEHLTNKYKKGDIEVPIENIINELEQNNEFYLIFNTIIKNINVVDVITYNILNELKHNNPGHKNIDDSYVEQVIDNITRSLVYLSDTIVSTYYNNALLADATFDNYNELLKQLFLTKSNKEVIKKTIIDFSKKLEKDKGLSKTYDIIFDYKLGYFKIINYQQGRNINTYSPYVTEIAELNNMDYKANNENVNLTYSHIDAADAFSFIRLINVNQGWSSSFKNQTTKPHHKVDVLNGINTFSNKNANNYIEIDLETKKKHLLEWDKIAQLGNAEKGFYYTLIDMNIAKHDLSRKAVEVYRNHSYRLSQEYRHAFKFKKLTHNLTRDRVVRGIAILMNEILRDDINRSTSLYKTSRYIRYGLLPYINNLIYDYIQANNNNLDDIVLHHFYIDTLEPLIGELFKEIDDYKALYNVTQDRLEHARETAKSIINKVIFGIESTGIISSSIFDTSIYQLFDILKQNIIYVRYLDILNKGTILYKLFDQFYRSNSVDAFFKLKKAFEENLNMFSISEEEKISLLYEFVTDLFSKVEKNYVLLLTDRSYDKWVYFGNKGDNLIEAINGDGKNSPYIGFPGDINFYLIMKGEDKNYAHLMQLRYDIGLYTYDTNTFEVFKLGKSDSQNRLNLIADLILLFSKDHQVQKDVSRILSFNNELNHVTSVSNLPATIKEGYDSKVLRGVYLKNITQAFSSLIMVFKSYNLQSGFLNQIIKQLLGKMLYIDVNKRQIIMDRIIEVAIGALVLYVLYSAYNSFGFLVSNIGAAIMFTLLAVSRPITDLVTAAFKTVYRGVIKGNAVRSFVNFAQDISHFIGIVLANFGLLFSVPSYFILSLASSLISSLLILSVLTYQVINSIFYAATSRPILSDTTYSDMIDRIEEMIQKMSAAPISFFALSDLVQKSITKRKRTTHHLVKYIMDANNAKVSNKLLQDLRSNVTMNNALNNFVNSIGNFIFSPLRIVFLFKSIFENNLTFYQLLYEVTTSYYIPKGLVHYVYVDKNNGELKLNLENIEKTRQKIERKLDRNIPLTEQERRFITLFPKDLTIIDDNRLVSILSDIIVSELPKKILATINNTNDSAFELSSTGKILTTLRRFQLHYIYHYIIQPILDFGYNTYNVISSPFRKDLSNIDLYLSNGIRAGLNIGLFTMVGVYVRQMLLQYSMKASMYGAAMSVYENAIKELQSFKCQFYNYITGGSNEVQYLYINVESLLADLTNFRFSVFINRLEKQKIKWEKEFDSYVDSSVLDDNTKSLLSSLRSKPNNFLYNVIESIDTNVIGSNVKKINELMAKLNNDSKARSLLDRARNGDLYAQQSLFDLIRDDYNNIIDAINDNIMLMTDIYVFYHDIATTFEQLEEISSRSMVMDERQRDLLAQAITRNATLFWNHLKSQLSLLQTDKTNPLDRYSEYVPFGDYKETKALIDYIVDRRPAVLRPFPASATTNYFGNIYKDIANFSSFIPMVAASVAEQIIPVYIKPVEEKAYSLINPDVSGMIQKVKENKRNNIDVNIVLLKYGFRLFDESTRDNESDASLEAMNRYRPLGGLYNWYNTVATGMFKDSTDVKVLDVFTGINRPFVSNTFSDFMSIDSYLHRSGYIPQINKYKILELEDLKKGCE